LTFNTSAPNNYYPTFNNLSVSSLVSLEKGLVKLLKDRNDPRIFQFGDPIVGKPANDFASYEGVDAGLIISDQQNAAPNASKIHRRYVKSEVNEPLVLIGFPEQEFLIAEGLARGWAAGNASGYYNSGVRASMRSFGIGGIGIEQYLGRPNVKYDAAKALELIAIQKYLALFMQSGWEPFLEQRRTGFPTFSIGPGTLNNGRVPKRWRYPQTEYENNRANVRAAVERQYGGNDEVNQAMWLLR
jgi:Starch-binding associating with outer membrane